MTPQEVLQPTIIFLGAGLISAFASRAVRLSPVIGYLLVGVVIGPSGLKLVHDNETTHFLGELGVVFLLFGIGLHFSLKELNTRRSDILKFAPLQVGLCAAAFALLGTLFQFQIPVALIVGASLALSSTAVVARILADRRKPGCPIGRSATAVLIAQDIVAIFIIVFAAVINEAPEAMGLAIGEALGKAIIALAIALLAGRFVVKPLFRALAATNNEDAFTVVALFIVLAASGATSAIGLSLTAGAFLAGMALSESSYRHVIQREVKPFESLLLGLFFMSVGMGVDLPAMLARWPIIVIIALAILVIKTLLIALAAHLNKRSLPAATQLGFLLSQGSEFTLVVVALPTVATAMGATWSSLIVSATAITMVASPLWTALGVRLSRFLADRQKADPVPTSEDTNGPPVLVLGMTEETRLAADGLRDNNIPYVVIESDPQAFVAAAADGYQVVYGDPRDQRLLKMTGSEVPRAIVHGASGQVLPDSMTHPKDPKIKVPARFITVEDQNARIRSASLGLRAHISATQPKGLEMTTDLLAHLGIDTNEISEWVDDELERRGLKVTNGDSDEDNDEPEAA